MPFTLAHTALAIPFRNKYLDFTGVVLGTMAPDFIYFILFNPSSHIGHTLRGFFLLNLPLCFLLNYLFYKYVEKIFIISLPESISKRYVYLLNYKNKINSLKDGVKFSYSALIGMITHVFWDAFTHKTGFFVLNIEVLRKVVIDYPKSIPVYKILQHGSTFIAIIILCFCIYKIRDKNPKNYKISINKRKIYLKLMAIFCLSLTLSVAIFKVLSLPIGVGRIVVTFLNGIIIAYFITGIIYYKKLKIRINQ